MTPSWPSALALAADSEHNRGRVRAACERRGIPVRDLSGTTVGEDLLDLPGLAYRLPVGLATRFHLQGVDLPLAVAPPDWLVRRPREATGRGLAVVSVAQLLAGEVPLERVRMVKLASAKFRGFVATRVADVAAARQAVVTAALPDDALLLLADDYLDCDSEYRTFTVGREVVAGSPYLVEGESCSRELVQHRASFHEAAADVVAGVLAELPEDDVPPGCVVDVARLPSGRMCLLEVNTSWGAGLYGCDPDGVLRSVLAANRAGEDRWRWRPDPGVLALVRAGTAEPGARRHGPADTS